MTGRKIAASGGRESVQATTDILLNEEKYGRLVALLDEWFLQGLGRGGVGPFRSSVVSDDIALLAGRIFKRGLATVCDVESGRVLKVPAEQEGQEWVPPLIILPREHVGQWLSSFSPDTTLVIKDAGFAACWPEFLHLIDARYQHSINLIPSESEKRLDTVRVIVKKALSLRAKACGLTFLVVGGGISSDLAGFAAGLLDAVIHILPTTLLAAVDAAIGGKTGANHSVFGKNQLGLFVSARSLNVAPAFFSSQDEKALLSGLVESIKLSWLFGSWEQDKQLAHSLLDSLPVMPESTLATLVRRSYARKSSVVFQDPKENSIRKFLNFGHTLGHALETLGEQGKLPVLPHGLAVAVGMRFLFSCGFFALTMAEQQDFLAFLDRLLARAAISTDALRIHLCATKNTLGEELWRLMLADKKNMGTGKVEFVIPSYGALHTKNDEKREVATRQMTKDEFWHALSCPGAEQDS